MGKFCSKCGVASGKFYGSFCEKCHIDQIKVEIPPKVKVVQCRKCGGLFVRNRWIEESPKNLRWAVASRIKEKISDISFLGDEAFFKLEITGKNEKVEMDIEQITCPTCQRIHTKRYEIKIQVRHLEETNGTKSDEAKFARVVSFIKKETHRMVNLEATSFWWEEQKEGIDFFFGFKKIGEDIFNKALDRFRMPHEISREFFGYDRDQKRKIATVYCLRV